MKTSEQTNEIAAALSKAQSEIEVAHKDAVNPHYKSKYATFVADVKAARKALCKNGLAVIQGGKFVDNHWVLITRIAHSSGQWYETEFPLIARDQSAQSMGSATTYAKRYSFEAMTGTISDDDDDGEHAEGRPAHLKAAIAVAGPKPSPVSVVPKPHTEPRLHAEDPGKRPITETEWKLIATKIKEVTKCDKDGIIEFVAHKTGKTSPKTLVFGDLLALENELGLMMMDAKLPF